MRKVQAWLVGGLLLLGSVVPVAAQDDRRGGEDGNNRDRGSQQDRNQQDRNQNNRGNQNNQNRGNQNRGNDNNRGNYQNRSNYYGGMHDQVRQGDYGNYVQQDESRHHHDSGGIGPGKAALIGGAGGAALGAIFGGGLKGTLIGGAAGAGIGAIGGKLAQGNNDHGDRR